MVQAGVDFATIPEIIKLADKYPDIYFGVGLHPHEAKLWAEDSSTVLSQAANHPKMVAIGECGLDFHYNYSDREAQLKAFRAQVRLARDLKKPLIIHTREAWDDTFEILKSDGQGQIKGVFHCFTGGPEHLEAIREIDFYVSFSGIVTFANAKSIQAAAPLIASDRILVETDCPYLAPVPFRGKRNEPAYVWHVADKLAQLRGCSREAIADITAQNARTLFGLPPVQSSLPKVQSG